MPFDRSPKKELFDAVADRLEVVLFRKTDKIYAFSLTRDGTGRIIASATSDMDDLVGNDILVHLGFSQDERQFFIDHIWDSDAMVISRAKRAVHRAVVIFNLFRRRSSFFLAWEIGISAEELLPALGRYFEEVSALRSVNKSTKRVLSDDCDEKKDAEEHISRICAVLSEIASLSTGRESCDLRLLEEVWAQETKLLGLPFLYRQQKGLHTLYANERMIFDGPSLFMVVTVVMMAVKRYADGDALTLTVREWEGIPLVDMSFPRNIDARWRTSLKRLYAAVENSHDHIFRCVYQSDRVRICFCPFYMESAEFSVKARDARELFLFEAGEEDPVEIVFLGGESE